MPPAAAVPEPAVTSMKPPVVVSAVVSPEVTVMVPASPELLLPTVTLMKPLLPFEAVPVPTLTEPLSPTLVVPALKLTATRQSHHFVEETEETQHKENHCQPRFRANPMWLHFVRA